MDKIKLPASKEELIGQNHARFIIGPLHPGYGPTLGNALRRVLLSSIPGTSATSLKVEGVAHEFSSIPHVKEDMIEIMMNVKALKLKCYSAEPKVIKLSKKGPGEVLSSDFEKNPEVEIINKNQPIATLDNKAELDMEVWVENNRGFIATENTDKKSGDIGQILIDASFSPVERVVINVENTRVGQMTNYDNLILEIKTTGAISPKEALIDAANILVDHYSAVAFDVEVDDKLTERVKDTENDQQIIQDKMTEVDQSEATTDPKTKIEDAGFSLRTTNALMNAGVKTVAGLKRMSELKLSEIRGMGKKGLDEINQAIGE